MENNQQDRLELTPDTARQLIDAERLEQQAGKSFLDPAAYDYLLEYLLKDLGYSSPLIDGMAGRLLMPDEAAKILDITPSTIRNWLKAGQLKGHKLSPRKWRIKGRDLAEFILIKTVCKVGQGAECCRYLAMGANGFTCLKKTWAKRQIDERVKNDDIKAKGDNF